MKASLQARRIAARRANSPKKVLVHLKNPRIHIKVNIKSAEVNIILITPATPATRGTAEAAAVAEAMIVRAEAMKAAAGAATVTAEATTVIAEATTVTAEAVITITAMRVTAEAVSTATPRATTAATFPVSVTKSWRASSLWAVPLAIAASPPPAPPAPPAPAAPYLIQ